MLLLAMSSTAAADGAWVHAGAAEGGGFHELGPRAASAFVDAHVWTSKSWGAYATALGFVAGELTQEPRWGSLVAAGASYRRQYERNGHPIYVHGSVGVGVTLDDHAFAWTARSGIGVVFGSFYLGTQLISYGSARGSAIEPLSLVLGASW
jgi:hypothetical protein